MTEKNNLRNTITQLYYADETTCVHNLLNNFPLTLQQRNTISNQAKVWIEKIRTSQITSHPLSIFLAEYNLSTTEGIALMALAESVLRVPDTHNIDRLIEEQLTNAHWDEHRGDSNAWWVNATTWGLLVTGKILKSDKNSLSELIKKTSKPIIRKAVKAALQILGHHFVLGEDITQAQDATKANQEYLYSFDMLGEGACTAADAESYYQAYLNAINTLAQKEAFNFHHPGISVKLSALHPRFEFTKIERLKNELFPRVLQLAQAAKAANISLTIDAEEAMRLDITLDIFEWLAADPSLENWNGLGLAVQAYQKRAPAVIDWIISLAHQYKKRIPIRLVKGAYWDSEIKFAQERGWPDYPVYTRKQTTDVCYLVCAEKLLNANEVIYPQFGTHNAYTVAAILALAKGYQDFEYQRLQGMGMELYEQVIHEIKIPCRVYAPVGKYEVLLPYLTRRLLENGANTSFVHQIADQNISVDTLLADPVLQLNNFENKTNPKIPLPRNIFPGRLAAKTLELSDRSVSNVFPETLNSSFPRKRESIRKNDPVTKMDSRLRGNDESVDASSVRAIDIALDSFSKWQTTPVIERAACLQRMADLLEQHMPEFISLIIDEGKRTIPNAISEVREAIDYCRYYAHLALKLMENPTALPGVTGETNVLILEGRGVMVCISPWNFPLAIFLGQVTAALVTGNTVIAKPAEQTPLIAKAAIELLYQAGIPQTVLHYVPGDGKIGAQLVKDPRIAGVIFTGSTETARSINQTLAQHPGPIIPFIAETGGINAMIVDSTALLEQVVHDVLTSAFDSAGQRCSAVRILIVQEEVADHLSQLLAGAMAELTLGDPNLLSTDIGPVIDEDAFSMLQKHQQWLEKNARLIYQMKLDTLMTNLSHLNGNDDVCDGGDYYFAPCAYEIKSLADINQEIFGPILHVVRYQTQDLPTVLNQLKDKGYGLTFGIHTRLLKEAEIIAKMLPIGNIYINRSMIGAVVGSQPFGGQGLSGTGPKAGGPHYLLRLVTEKVITTNITATGGNTNLLTLY